MKRALDLSAIDADEILVAERAAREARRAALIEARRLRAVAALKRATRRLKLAKTLWRKYQKRVRYYEKLGAGDGN